jgi:A/G-specific adenine glycosylase
MRPTQMTLPDASWFRSFRRRLPAWFDRHARKLPWRGSHDPYSVWVSEIMLQQTQVGTVIGYFDRFLATFPTIEALAAADEHDVLRLWEGLGYYRRARQLQQAAKIIVAEHDGAFPRNSEVVRRLPGVGRYTAGAILSIAFDAREPIIEANTLRLLSRLLAYDGDPRSNEGQRLLWAMADAVLPRHGSGRMNQALMELGSEVCTARSPRCEDCPVAALCHANQQGRQAEIPRPKAKRTIESVRQAVVIVRRRGRVLLLRWPEGRRFAGLWDFPRFPIESDRPADVRRELADNVLALTGVVVAPGRQIKTLTHGVTRFRITLECYEAAFLSNGNSAETALETRWLRPEELETYPLSSTGRKLARLLQAVGHAKGEESTGH